MAGELVLVVDDNAQNLKLARVLLQSAGYDVKTAVDAADALRVLQTVAPKLVLMDLQLPDLDGLELTRRLKVGTGICLGLLWRRVRAYEVVR